MDHIFPGHIVRYHKGPEPPRFSTLKERTKVASWVDIWEIQNLVLEAEEDLLTPTDISSQIPTNLEEANKDGVGDKFTREDMVNMWSTEYLMGHYEREILVWYHWLNHCSLEYLLGLSKR